VTEGEAGSPSRPVTRNRAYFQTVARLGMQAAEALEHAHEVGVIHLDMKPSNLLVDSREKLWITDFGLARFQNDSALTATGDLLGTLRYMGPEQAQARRVVVDHRTHIYSLGITLYELLTLCPAYEEGDRQELLRRIIEEEPRRPRLLTPAIPADLETIVLKAIAKDASGRYSTARALAEDLGRFLEGRLIGARRATLLDRTAKWSRRHRNVVVAAAGLLVLAMAGLVVGAALLARQRDEARRRSAELMLDRAFAERTMPSLAAAMVMAAAPKTRRR
jgi:serine/threonine protein kinase